ncbi:hypothetical protein [Photorhabdus sp. RW14-46]|nr:hypothetical protein [Photorhabdus sp. RW14-46]
MTGVSESSQQSSSLKDEGYIRSRLTYLGLSGLACCSAYRRCNDSNN